LLADWDAPVKDPVFLNGASLHLHSLKGEHSDGLPDHDQIIGELDFPFQGC
jgi:hypothetical protein